MAVHVVDIVKGASLRPIGSPSQLVLSLQFSARCLSFRTPSTLTRCTIWVAHHSAHINICFGLTFFHHFANHDAGIFSVSAARCAQPSPRWWLPDVSPKPKPRLSHITIWTAATHESAQSTSLANSTFTESKSISATSNNGLPSIWRCNVPESRYFDLRSSRHGYCGSFRYAKTTTDVGQYN